MSAASNIARGLASNPAIGAVLVLAAIGGFVYWQWGDEIGAFLSRIRSGFDPTSDQNFAYSGVNAAGAAVSGDEDFTLGGWIYDLTHPPYDPNEGNGGTATPASKGPPRR